jgi:hypothetical protein
MRCGSWSPRARCYPRPALKEWGRLPRVPSIITHFAGMQNEERQFLMRAYGYWHYHPADTLTHEFPMDDSRVLQLATPPEGLVLTTLSEYQVSPALSRPRARLCAARGRCVCAACGWVWSSDACPVTPTAAPKPPAFHRHLSYEWAGCSQSTGAAARPSDGWV